MSFPPAHAASTNVSTANRPHILTDTVVSILVVSTFPESDLHHDLTHHAQDLRRNLDLFRFLLAACATTVEVLDSVDIVSAWMLPAAIKPGMVIPVFTRTHDSAVPAVTARVEQNVGKA